MTQGITAGTGVTVGNATLAGGGVSSSGSLNLAAGGGANLVLTSGTDTVELGAGTNKISNSDAGANLVLSASGDIKIKDGDLFILGSMPADPLTATNGASYYNSVTNIRRCYIAGAWENCNANAFRSASSVTELGHADRPSGDRHQRAGCGNQA